MYICVHAISVRSNVRTSDIFQSFSVNVRMLSTLSGHCVSSKEAFMAVGGCHCSGDRFVVCHFLLLIGSGTKGNKQLIGSPAVQSSLS